MEEKRQRAKKIEVPERGLSDKNVSRRRPASKTTKKRQTPKTTKKRPTARRKKRPSASIVGRVIQVLLVIALIGVLFFVIRNFGEGNKLNNKGLEAYEQADYETANAYFAKAIGYDGSNGEYYMNQGMAQSELKLYDDAMASFEQALEFMKRDSDIQLVYRAMGISLLYQGKYDEALEAFDKALDGKESRFSATEIDILYYKAETQDKAGKYVEAVMTYTQIVESEKSADAYMLRGMEYVKVGDSTNAENDLRTAIKKDKKNYEIYLALYDALSAQNKTEDAKTVLNEALELGGNKGADLVNQGKIYMELGDLTQAEEKLQKALDKGENSANLGLAEAQSAKNADRLYIGLSVF